MRKPSLTWWATMGFGTVIGGLGVLLFGFLPEWIILPLDKAGIVFSLVGASIAAGGVLALTFMRPERAGRWLRAFLKPPSYHENQHLDPRWVESWLKGMVIPVSRYEQPAWILNHLKPKAVALIFTEQEKSRQAAQRLQEEFRDRIQFLNEPLDSRSVVPLLLEKPHDPAESKKLARHFLDRLEVQGFDRSALAIDTTGGTVPMSLGLFQAAAEKGVRAFYIVGNEETEKASQLILHPEKRDAGTAILVSGQEGGSEG